MRGRWGGQRGSFKFFIKKFYDRINLSSLKTVTAKEDYLADTKKIEDIQYTDFGGIHTLEGVAQFPKKAVALPENIAVGSSVTFTSPAIGPFGPSKTAVANQGGSYSSLVLDTDYTVYRGIQYLKLTAGGTYRIKAYGASCKSNFSSAAGVGVVIQGDFVLGAGDTLAIVVGQNVEGMTSTRAWRGGSGGTFVSLFPASATGDYTPLIIAGGAAAGRDSTSAGNVSRMNGQRSTRSDGGSSNQSGITGGTGYGNSYNQSSVAYSSASGGWNGTSGNHSDTRGVSQPSLPANVHGEAAWPTTTTQPGAQKALISVSSIGAIVPGFPIGTTPAYPAQGGLFNNTYDTAYRGSGGFGCGGPGGWGGAGGAGGYSGGSNGNNSTGEFGGGGGSFIAASASNPATSDGTWTTRGDEPDTPYGDNGGLNAQTVTNLNEWNESGGTSSGNTTAGNGKVIITRIS